MWRSVFRNAVCNISRLNATSSVFARFESTVSKFPDIDKYQDSLGSYEESVSHPSYAQEFFTGKFDPDLLAFPEVLDADGLSRLEETVKAMKTLFNQRVDSHFMDERQHIPDSVLNDLKEMGLFGHLVPVSFGGANVTATEYARYREATSHNSSVGEFLYEHAGVGLQGLLLSQNEVMKERYLKAIAQGDFYVTLCLMDNEFGFDCTFKTKAVLDTDGSKWILNGMKHFVTGAFMRSLFLVVAQTEEPDRYMIVLVDSQSEGVTIEPLKSQIGIKDATLYKVTFTQTPVPKENVIANAKEAPKLIMNSVLSCQFSYGSSSAETLKSIITLSVESALQNYKGNRKYGMDTFMKTLSDICCKMYAMESMTYLTAGILDSPRQMDSSIESAIVKVYTSENLLSCVDSLQHLFGNRACVKGFPYERILRDSRASSVRGMGNDVLRLIIAEKGLRYSKNATPRSCLEDYFYQAAQKKDLPKLNLKLHYYVHPSLEVSAKQLEYCVKRLQYVVEKLLAQYDDISSLHNVALYWVADIVINIYAMTAVLGRASRSYCIGLQDSDYEMLLASAFCIDSLRQVKSMVGDILDKSAWRNEWMHMCIGRKMVHDRNVWDL